MAARRSTALADRPTLLVGAGRLKTLSATSRSVNMSGRPLWLLLGFAATACAIAGAVLPLVPTTPFLLVAAYAFARSSPRLHAWLLGHPRFGPLITDWQRHGAISRGAKAGALTVIGLTPLITLAMQASTWILVVQLIVLVPVTLFIVTRPDRPREPAPHE
jgi:uncharacterized protein